jgi:NAD(P)-dependent dehydrogenase (short-subunit alcohol dehydrogenase family)
MNAFVPPPQPGETSLQGRRIFITGAASGIGRETALLFAREGAKLALLDRDAAQLDEVAAQTGGLALACDITDEAGLIAAAAQAAQALGGLDGLVHAAGIGFSGTLMETSLADWRRVIDVNLTGGFLVCRTVVPYLQKEEQATIVNVSSGIGVRAAARRGAYGASKAGFISFTRAIAQELGPKIRVNVLCPGLIDTQMVRKTRPTDADVQKNADHYAMKRPGRADEMAQTILFLTSARSSFVTGSVVMADGGQ